MGVRIGYRTADRWSFEGALAGVHIDSFALFLIPVSSTPPSTRLVGTAPDDILLLSLGASYSVVRSAPLDLYLSGSAGRIAHGPSDDREADPFVSAGTGALLHLWRPFFLRGDAKVYGHWCGREPQDGVLACGDGSFLTHYEVSGGIQIVFHRYMGEDDDARIERKEASR